MMAFAASFVAVLGGQTPRRSHNGPTPELDAETVKGFALAATRTVLDGGVRRMIDPAVATPPVATSRRPHPAQPQPRGEELYLEEQS